MGVDVFFSSALVGERSALLPGEATAATHGIRWVDPQSVCTIWRSENSLPHRDSNSDPSTVQPTASRIKYRAMKTCGGVLAITPRIHNLGYKEALATSMFWGMGVIS
jgi:hypothetical protein